MRTCYNYQLPIKDETSEAMELYQPFTYIENVL